MVDTDDTRRTTDEGHRTTPRVWHKLPTGELKMAAINCIDFHYMTCILNKIFQNSFYLNLNLNFTGKQNKEDLC